MSDIQEALGADGALSRVLSGFRPRDGQIRLAEAIAEALATGDALVAEAGTGIGKTFAYLVPAMLFGRKIIISTGTRHLQDQLFHSDIPRLRDALSRPLRAELLKGRANYYCHHRAAQVVPRDAGEARRLQSVRQWSASTRSGDLAELPDLRDRDPLRPGITSTSENCLGGQCPDYQECFVVRARARAQEAEVVVVNHHLLCADLALRDEGFGELLPEADAVVVDEAHQFPAVLAQFFGFGVSARQCRDLGRDVITAADLFGDAPALKDRVAALGDALQALQGWFPLSRQRLDSDELTASPDFMAAANRSVEALKALAAGLEEQAGRGPEMATAWRRAGLLLDRLQRWLSGEADQMVRWAERQAGGFAMQAIPMDVAPAMAVARERLPGAWVMTSATLSVSGDFGHFLDRLGLDDARTLEVASPFDYANQSRLFLPPGLPEPNSPRYARSLLALGQELIEAAAGGCFWLCTSLRAVEEYAHALRRWGRFPVLEQGRQERSQLLEAFRADRGAVLVGTSSFWEGVDVRGAALRLVIIDRLPFTSPDDPVLKARSALLRAAGRHPFMDHQVPQAVLALKQGAGRLIRDVDDYGVLVIGDCRVQSKPYGGHFLASLPPMRRSHDLAEVQDFLRGMPR